MNELGFREAGRRPTCLEATFGIGERLNDYVRIVAMPDIGVTVSCTEFGKSASVHYRATDKPVAEAIEGALRLDVGSIAMLRKVAFAALLYCRQQMAEMPDPYA